MVNNQDRWPDGSYEQIVLGASATPLYHQTIIIGRIDFYSVNVL